MNRIGPTLAALAMLAGLTGCATEPAYPFKGRGYTPPETFYAYASDDSSRSDDHVYRAAARRGTG